MVVVLLVVVVGALVVVVVLLVVVLAVGVAVAAVVFPLALAAVVHVVVVQGAFASMPVEAVAMTADYRPRALRTISALPVCRFTEMSRHRRPKSSPRSSSSRSAP